MTNEIEPKVNRTKKGKNMLLVENGIFRVCKGLTKWWLKESNPLNRTLLK